MPVCLVAQFLRELGFVRILIFLDYGRKCISKSTELYNLNHAILGIAILYIHNFTIYNSAYFELTNPKIIITAYILFIKPSLLYCPNTVTEALVTSLIQHSIACSCTEKLTTTIGANFRFKRLFFGHGTSQ